MLDSSNGLAINDTSLWRTGNTGTSWTRITIPTGSWSAIYAPDANNIWLVGGTTIIRSADGGISFAAVSVPPGFTGYQWTSVGSLGAAVAVVGQVSDTTAVLSYSSGGVIQSQSKLPGMIHKTLVTATNSNYGFMYAQYNTAHTVTGGSAWNPSWGAFDFTVEKTGFAFIPGTLIGYLTSHKGGIGFLDVTNGFSSWATRANFNNRLLAVAAWGSMVWVSESDTASGVYRIHQSNDSGFTWVNWTVPKPIYAFANVGSSVLALGLDVMYRWVPGVANLKAVIDSVRLVPSSPRLNDTVKVSCYGRDPDGKSVSWHIIFGNGSSSIWQTRLTANNGDMTSFQSTAVYAAAGTYQITVEAVDQAGDTTRAPFLITVSLPANLPPQIISVVGDSVVTLGQAGNYTVTGYDPDGTRGSFDAIWNDGTQAVPVVRLVATVGSSMQVQLSKSWSATGVYSVQFRITDNDGAVATQAFTVRVPSANQAPVIDSVVVWATKPLVGDTILSTVYARDPDGRRLASSFNPGDGGSVTATNVISTTVGAQVGIQFSHIYTVVGSYTATYTVADSLGYTASRTMLIPISVRAQGPKIVNQNGPASIGRGVSFTFKFAALDSNGRNLNGEIVDWGDGAVSGPQLLVASSVGGIVEFSFSHSYATAGNKQISMKVTDAEGMTDQATWTIFVSTVTGVEMMDGSVPTQFALGQNYPNPFNPATTIEYALPRSSFVSLRVYNLLGVEVRTLVQEEQPAGRFRASFDGSDLASGIYLLHIRAGGFTKTQKMVLTK